MSHNIYQKQKKLLFNIAYRLLGSVSDTEDVLQEAWLRWKQKEKQNISSPEAYLTTIVSRLCIDVLRSRKNTIKEYKGPWLPEPLATNVQAGLVEKLELTNDLSIALLFILERLSPKERAVFVLREAFDFKHEEISDTLEIDISNSRQLLSRAKRKLKLEKPRETVEKNVQKQIINSFMSALWDGDTDSLKSMLTDDAVAYTDGGGIVTAAIIPLEGPGMIIQVFSHLANTFGSKSQIEFLEINGEIGIAIFVEKQLESISTMSIINGKIDQIFVQRNPEKLIPFQDLQTG